MPARITTPDTVETRFGTLRFRDGAPDPATVQLVYDQIDFNRGVDAFLKGMSATSVYAGCRGLEQAGVRPNGGIGISEQLMDARSLFLTPNTTTVYVLMCVNLTDGPMVVRVPPRALGPVGDADFRWVTDVGLTGPDKGAGGDYSGVKFNTISANDFSFYEELNAVVQNEPADWVDPDSVGLYAAIGIRKGQPFAPDARRKKTLTEAVAVGNAFARSNAWASRDPRTRIFSDRQWLTPFVGGSYQFLSGAERLLDAESMFFYLATGITPAMSDARPGTGSAYALSFLDAQGNYLDGGRTYSVTLPGPVPAKDFWAFTVYDNQTRSLLPTDQKSAGLDSNSPGLKKNADGGATIWFGPKVPAGMEANWVQTMPGRGFNLILRLYGPLEPWFNQTWRSGDLEVKS